MFFPLFKGAGGEGFFPFFFSPLFEGAEGVEVNIFPLFEGEEGGGK